MASIFLSGTGKRRGRRSDVVVVMMAISGGDEVWGVEVLAMAGVGVARKARTGKSTSIGNGLVG